MNEFLLISNMFKLKKFIPNHLYIMWSKININLSLIGILTNVRILSLKLIIVSNLK